MFPGVAWYRPVTLSRANAEWLVRGIVSSVDSCRLIRDHGVTGDLVPRTRYATEAVVDEPTEGLVFAFRQQAAHEPLKLL
jgi:hypothetical protein